MNETTPVLSNDHLQAVYSPEDNAYQITPRSSDAAWSLARATRNFELAPFSPKNGIDDGTDEEKHGRYDLAAADGYWLGRLLDETAADAVRRRTPGTAAPPLADDEPHGCRAKVPDTVTVVLADTQGTYLAAVHENEHRPYQRRTVQIRLTDEQRRALRPRHTGMNAGRHTHEEHLDAWLEPATTPLAADAVP